MKTKPVDEGNDLGCLVIPNVVLLPALAQQSPVQSALVTLIRIPSN